MALTFLRWKYNNKYNKLFEISYRDSDRNTRVRVVFDPPLAGDFSEAVVVPAVGSRGIFAMSEIGRGGVTVEKIRGARDGEVRHAKVWVRCDHWIDEAIEEIEKGAK